MVTWKRDFASGLIVLLPLLVTVFVLLWLYNRLAQIPVPVASPPLRVALTLVVFVLLVFSIGYMMRTALGTVVESTLDDLMNRLPGLRVVYNASKMAVETAVSGTEGLQTPVKIEPWPGVRMTAFKTGKQTADGRDVLFFPTAPNITTGFVIEMDSADYEETSESVEDALTRLLSAGFGETSEEDLQNVIGDVTAQGEPEDRSQDEEADADAT
ncbi:hypothetical protein BRD09_00460 [Halobacteriales archaeon SW_10_68_16]|jgi:uncharacterized membrane protein|nr:MAG: hypothetical protein BRD09_00460 [Halobacteriales archaeon SW_10_68_16]